MNKPRHIKYTNKIGEPCFESVAGYNKACKEWEIYHNEVIKELLEACKEALRMLKFMKIYPFDTHDKIKQLKQAIAKAEGNQ